MSVKITLIGAGSVVFAKSLLGDILQFPALADASICLMDIDPARLKVAETMTRRMVARLGVPARVEATLDQRRAIQGARYVICTIQVGGYEPGTVLDFEIPRKYGLRQTIADTLGVGGVFRGLRTIPVINRIAADIAEVGAPGCLLLNYTNPMAMVCHAVDRAVGIPHVGLCHSVQSTSRRLAAYAGLPYEDVRYRVAGINHMAFFLDFAYRGRDAYPLLFRKLSDPAFAEDKVRFEMMRRTGYFVTESSEHQSEYLPYFIPHGSEMVERFDIPLDDYLRRCESIMDTWKATESRLLGGEGEIEIGPQTHEYGAFIIHSRETNTPRVIYGNVPNRRPLTNLPEGCCVEVPCRVDGRGLHPEVIGDLPPQLAALCQTNINVQTLTVEAALTGKREAIYHAVMTDPNTAATLPLDRIWAMCDELIEAHQRHGLIGPFAPTIPHTGRAYHGVGDCLIVDIERDPRRPDGVVASLTNPRQETVPLAFRLEVRDGRGRTLDHREAVFEAVPGRSSQFLPVALPADSEEGFRVVAEGLAPGVLAVDLVVPARRILRADPAQPAFDLSLAGSPAVRAWIEDAGSELHLHAVVEDSHITLGKLPWSGSSLEFFFAAEGSGQFFQVILTPGLGDTPPALVDSRCRPVAGARLVQEKAGAGYEIDLIVPKTSLHLEEDAGAFLLDCYANITALGEAHSGGRTSLSGSFLAHLGPALYARVVFDREICQNL